MTETDIDDGPLDPRPAPGSQARLDEAPDRDEDAPDPPWVRRPGRDAGKDPKDGPRDGPGEDAGDDSGEDPDDDPDGRESN